MLRPIMQGLTHKSRKANRNRKAAALANVRPALDRIASAADISVNSARAFVRTGGAPRNRHVREQFLAAVAAELRPTQVPADIK
jgi:hypothetical protein